MGEKISGSNPETEKLDAGKIVEPTVEAEIDMGAQKSHLDLSGTQIKRKIDDVRESLVNQYDQHMISREEELIAKDPELQSLYQDVIEKCDFDRLQEKSAKQASQLSDRYFGRFSLLGFRERSRKKDKLKLFEDFVESLTPVRADANEYAEYKSPELTGKIESYGPQDTIVKSEQFVYGSFAEFGHLMSHGPHQRRLDVKDITPRAQIIMNDIANVISRVPNGESFTKKYLQNMFDFENGKKILSLYLASVFDTPQQAKDMISGAGGAGHSAQNWDRFQTLNYHDTASRDKAFQSEEEYQAQREYEEKMTQVFTERMKSLLEDTGIEPPLSIEIRVKDTAKTVPVSLKEK